ncbi:MAG: Ppx/GppA phosphatase family protein [Microthrixaceae bacterium]
MTQELYAAIDCGTNSTRLLVSDGINTQERLMQVTRLGAGVDKTSRLDPAAIERTLAVLREYRNLMDQAGVVGLRAAATSACRDATNSADFMDAASLILGQPPELLTGSQEAELSFLGATSGLEDKEILTLVVDIGGGSTEFALGRAEVEESISIDVGCVRMTEKFLAHDPPLPEELSNCISVIEQHLDDVSREIPLAGSAVRFIGLAGTVTNVAAVELGLKEYTPEAIHGFVLTKEAAEDVFRTLATEAVSDRVHNPGLEAQRADVIVGGCCVLVEIFRYFGFEQCLVSESDILDGLILSQIAR